MSKRIKKLLISAVLIFLGYYWFFVHTAPLPFNHEQFGLYNHEIHRIVGILFIFAAGVVWWKWKPKNK